MKKIGLLVTVSMLFFTGTAFAQIDTGKVSQKIRSDLSKTADELKTGQANDIITNFYQLGIKNIFGDKKEVSYSSTIFGLQNKLTDKYTIDSLYGKTRWQRNVELNVSGKINDDSRLTGFGGGVKFYLLNKRDITNKKIGFDTLLKKYEMQINSDMVAAKQTVLLDPNGATWLANNNAAFQKFYKSFDYHDLPQSFIDILRKMHSGIVEERGLAASAAQEFEDRVNAVKQKPLWSLGGNYYHSVNGQADTSTLSSEFLVGFKTGKQRKASWEYNASGYLKFFNSPENAGPAKKLHLETGFNGVLSKASDGTSNMELKFFGSYDRGYNTASIPLSTKANLTYRYLVSQLGGFWVPVTFSWDPGNGKIFGLVDLTFNIDPVKK